MDEECAGTVGSLCRDRAGTAQANAADGFAAGGHWVAERGMFIFFNQETVSVPNELQIDIEIDDSNHPALFIKMTETYIPGASTGYHVDERIVKAKTFNVVGAVSYANDRIVWGDVDDTTVWSCDIVSVDRSRLPGKRTWRPRRLGKHRSHPFAVTAAGIGCSLETSTLQRHPKNLGVFLAG